MGVVSKEALASTPVVGLLALSRNPEKVYEVP